MPCLAPSKPGATLPDSIRSLPAREADQNSSSAADNPGETLRAARSLSPSVPKDHCTGSKEEQDGDGLEPVMGDPASQKASYRDSAASIVSASSTSSTATTSTSRRYWSPTSPSSPWQIRLPLSQIPDSLPPDRKMRWSGSPAPGSASSASSTLSASSTVASSAASTAASSVDGSVTGITLRLPLPAPYTSEHVVTYIPPLVDGAGGSLSRWQRANQWQAGAGVGSILPFAHSLSFSRIKRFTGTGHAETALDAASHEAVLSPYRLLWSDLRWLGLSTPKLVRLLGARAAKPLGAIFRSRAWTGLLSVPFDDVADAAEVLVQVVLAVVEYSMLCAAPVLFLCLPGGLFTAWLLVCLTIVRIASWPLNSGARSQTGTVYRGPWDTNVCGSVDSIGSDTETDDSDDDGDQRLCRKEKWFFVSGLGATSRSLAKTGPRLAGVFGRPVTLVRPAYTYGIFADCMLALLHRLLLPFCVLPVPGADTTVYASLLQALGSEHGNKGKENRVVVLAHNTGATAVAQALRRLAGQVAHERLARIQVYTFGSLAPDFVLPRCSSGAAIVGSCHVEHIAHVHDPCARFGVLRSVQHDLAGRYCGGVFVLGGTSRNAGVHGTHVHRATAGLGLHVSGLAATPSAATGRRPSIGRRRSGSPPLVVRGGNSPAAVSGWNNDTASRQRRRSFPLSYQKLQLHQQQLHGYQRAAYRRSGSAASSTCTLMAPSSITVPLTSRTAMFSMEDYLTALFGPEPWSMRPESDLDRSLDVDLDLNFDWELDPGLDRHGKRRLACDAFFLDAAISVDYELAKKREMAALAAASALLPEETTADVNVRRSVAKRAHHRLSWTGLGATAKFGTVQGSFLFGGGDGGTSKGVPQSKRATTASASFLDSQALVGLETVRRMCKECDGRPGRDVSLLGGYFADAVARHRERFGF
ncbi:hypothetical protein SEPCBS119000_000634 [Sporothrix epigloea]|uniref:Uncharacterized protein n=1 Tax=Sporothrix epigloea TaxID=1892477 RepID=A0ABP0D696_9PEZI